MKRFLSILLFGLCPWLAFGQGSPVMRFNTVAEMLAHPLPSIATRYTAFVAGRTTTNDQGGGTFIYDATSTATTNLGTVFAYGTGRLLRQYYGPLNVNWFGATPNDATDDFAAITNCLASADSVYFPSGVYLTSKGLPITRDGQRIVGDGYSSRIVVTVAGTNGFYNGNSGVLNCISLENLRVECATNVVGGTAFHLARVNESTFRNLHVTKEYEDALTGFTRGIYCYADTGSAGYINHFENIRVRTVTQPGVYGVVFDGDAVGYGPNATKITGGHIYGNAGVGLLVTNTVNITLRSVTFQGAMDTAVRLETLGGTSAGHLIEGCYFEGMTNGIYSAPDGVTLLGNNFSSGIATKFNVVGSRTFIVEPGSTATNQIVMTRGDLKLNNGKLGVSQSSPVEDVHVGGDDSNRSLRISSGSAGTRTASMFLGTDARDWRMRANANPYSCALDYVGTDVPRNILLLGRDGEVSIDGGLHVGGTSAAGDGNMVVDGDLTVGAADWGNRTITLTSGANGTDYVRTLFGTQTRFWELLVDANPYDLALSYVGTDAPLTNVMRFSRSSGNVSFSGTITGTNMNLSGVANIDRALITNGFVFGAETILPASGTNYVIDFFAASYHIIAATDNVNLLQTTNRVAGGKAIVYIDPNGSDRTLSLNGSWRQDLNGLFYPTITNGTIHVLYLNCFGVTETEVTVTDGVFQ